MNNKLKEAIRKWKEVVNSRIGIEDQLTAMSIVELLETQEPKNIVKAMKIAKAWNWS